MTLSDNGLIFQLAKEDQNRVQSICELVELRAGQTLCDLGHVKTSKVYFLAGACVALLVQNRQHNTLAVGLVGSEGVVGFGSVLNNGAANLHYRVQTSGAAWAADSAAMALLLHQRPGMLWVISQHLWHLADHVASMAASFQFDDISTRLALWLVLSAERAKTLRLMLTHEHLAQMLGVRRVSITLSAGELKEKGLINYQRGVIEILKPLELHQVAYRNRPEGNLRLKPVRKK